jgi:hypothetical protein
MSWILTCRHSVHDRNDYYDRCPSQFPVASRWYPIIFTFHIIKNNYFLETHLTSVASIPVRRHPRFPCHGISDSYGRPRIMSSCHPNSSTHHDEQSTFSYWKSIIMIKITRSNKSISQILRTINFSPSSDCYPIAILHSISIHVMWFHFHLRREVSYQVHLYISYYKK